MKFDDLKFIDYTGSNFNVSKHSNGLATLTFSNGFKIQNFSKYSEIYLGKCSSCSNSTWINNNFNGFSYDKVLVAGLGFGLIPQELKTIDNCSKVDVVEIDQELINYINNCNQLDNNINIIQDDIYNYNTSDLYDLIIIDIIWNSNEMTEVQYQSLETKFLNNLNTGGALYTPVKEKWVIK